MTSLKTSIKTITYLSDTGCLEIQGASLVYFNIIGTLSDSELNKINNYVDEYYKQWGKQYVRFNVNLKNQDTNNSSFSYGDNRFEKSQGSNWTFQE
ncbi:type III secretion system protein EprH [Escherichia coli]|nr:type III secretion system protein EprH [Escherichia coli]